MGGLEYLVQRNDIADIVDLNFRFKYIDDLLVLQLVLLYGWLVEYDFHQHVASDIGIDMQYLPATSYSTQDQLNSISDWTHNNLMKLNEAKSNYMIFTRTKESFATRLTVNDVYLDRKSVTQLLGVWISEDLSWSRNCQEICRKAFSRLSLITKLRYVGVSREDLLDIYILFVRSVAEYCSVSFHSSITKEQSYQLERIQKICLKVILGDSYEGYQAALDSCGLQTLSERREKRCLDFSLKCIKHPRNNRLFPKNPGYNSRVRLSEKYTVNFASTDSYKLSAIPHCQRLLNKHLTKTTTTK